LLTKVVLTDVSANMIMLQQFFVTFRFKILLSHVCVQPRLTLTGCISRSLHLNGCVLKSLGAAKLDAGASRGIRRLSGQRFEELTVKELIGLLKKRGLSVSGRKADLINRLTTNTSSKPVSKVDDLEDTDSAEALKYEKKTPVEHVLLRPDSYVGSIKPTSRKIVVLSPDCSLKHRQVSFVPALLKVFDEILVNAVDNFHRDPEMRVINVIVDPTRAFISIRNDGR
jgi:hypothetical protein